MNTVVIHPNMLSNKAGHNERVISIEDLESTENSSLLSISALDCLDYVVYEQRNVVLGLIRSKIRQGGILDVHGCDIFAAASSMYNGRMNLDKANDIMFQNKRSMDTLDRMIVALKSLELEIVNYKIEDFTYHIKARRPVSVDSNIM